MSRPPLDIDPEQVKRLAEVHATMEEIAHVMGCSVDTLERRFKDVIDAARSTGKVSLRRKQFELAMAGDVRSLMWLGKIVLGQSDKVTYEIEGEGFVFERTNGTE